MTFDWTVTVGNLVAAIGPVIGFIVVGAMFLSKIGTQMALIDLRMKNAETDLKDMTLGIRQLASDSSQIVALSERTTGIDQRLTEISHRVTSLESSNRIYGMEERTKARREK